MSAITTHVLDAARGRPAAGLDVVLERTDGDAIWQLVGRAVTAVDGRVASLLPESGSAPPGLYRLTFATRAYFERHGVAAFFPSVAVTFEVVDGEAHHHVPLIVGPFGYTTYRGS